MKVQAKYKIQKAIHVSGTDDNIEIGNANIFGLNNNFLIGPMINFIGLFVF